MNPSLIIHGSSFCGLLLTNGTGKHSFCLTFGVRDNRFIYCEGNNGRDLLAQTIVLQTEDAGAAPNYLLLALVVLQFLKTLKVSKSQAKGANC